METKDKLKLLKLALIDIYNGEEQFICNSFMIRLTEEQRFTSHLIYKDRTLWAKNNFPILYNSRTTTDSSQVWYNSREERISILKKTIIIYKIKNFFTWKK